MTFFRQLGEVGRLRERLILKFFRKERFDVVHIERDVSVVQPLEGLQLGSGGIEFDHFGCVGCIPVEWW